MISAHAVPGDCHYHGLDDFALFHDDPGRLEEWRARIERFLEGCRLRLHPRKTEIVSTREPARFLGFVLLPGGRRRLPEDNVRRFRNRLRGLRDRWRHGTVTGDDVERRVRSWIAHAEHADSWRLRQTIFRGGWFDPSREPDPPPGACLRGGSWNNNPRKPALREPQQEHHREPEQQQRVPCGPHARRPEPEASRRRRVRDERPGRVMMSGPAPCLLLRTTEEARRRILSMHERCSGNEISARKETARSRF